MVFAIKAHAYPFATVADGSSPPPITATTSLRTHVSCADAGMVDVKRLEPKLLHAVILMLIATTVAADATDINMMLTFLVLVMLNVMVMMEKQNWINALRHSWFQLS